MGCLTGLPRILHDYSLERKAEWDTVQAALRADPSPYRRSGYDGNATAYAISGSMQPFGCSSEHHP